MHNLWQKHHLKALRKNVYVYAVSQIAQMEFLIKKSEGKENKGKLTTRLYHLHKQEDVVKIYNKHEIYNKNIILTIYRNDVRT